MTINSSTTIAIQRRGKLREASQIFLKAKGIDLPDDDSQLVSVCEQSGVRILYLRDDDIPEYVIRGVADYGIVGENVLYENNYDVNVQEKLQFGACRLVIAVPEASSIQSVQDLEGERIATSYPYLLQNYLQVKRIHAAIIPIQGSVELTPELNLADAVCDLTQTGATLQAHNLRVIETVLESQAVIIRNILADTQYSL